MKKDARVSIQNEFNSQKIENPRTAIILKTKYENIKRNIKKQYAEEKTFNRGTGGGPVKQFFGLSVASTVGEILQTKMTGEPSIYDSDLNQFESDQIQNKNIDYSYENDDVNIITVTNLPETLSDNDTGKCETFGYEVADDTPSVSTKRNWTNYTPAGLKSRSTLTSSAVVSGMYFILLFIIDII